MRPSGFGLCAGLIPALEDWRRTGSSSVFDQWWGGGWSSLCYALRRAGADEDLAEEVAERVLIVALEAVIAGRQIRAEVPWLTRVSSRILLAARRTMARTESLLVVEGSKRSSIKEPVEKLAAKDASNVLRQRVADASRALPEPHATVVRIRFVEGSTRAAAAEFLIRWSELAGEPIGRDRAIALCKVARQRLVQYLKTGFGPPSKKPHLPKKRWKDRPPPHPSYPTYDEWLGLTSTTGTSFSSTSKTCVRRREGATSQKWKEQMQHRTQCLALLWLIALFSIFPSLSMAGIYGNSYATPNVTASGGETKVTVTIDPPAGSGGTPHADVDRVIVNGTTVFNYTVTVDSSGNNRLLIITFTGPLVMGDVVSVTGTHSEPGSTVTAALS